MDIETLEQEGEEEELDLAHWVILKDDGWNLMSSKDRIEALEAGAGVVETRTGKLAGSEKKEEAKEQEGQMEPVLPEDEKRAGEAL